MALEAIGELSTTATIGVGFVGLIGYKVVSTLIENWFKRTNQEYVTKAHCSTHRAQCMEHKDIPLRKLVYQVNQLKQVMFKIGIKVGLNEDELNRLVSMNGDSDEKIKR